MQKTNQNNKAPVQQGLVISYFGSSVAVEAEDGQVFQCHLRRNQELPVVGDRVEWQLDEKANTGTILTILPRRTQLSRGDAHGNAKPIAANIDNLIIVMAPPPIFSAYLVDRYTVAAELLTIQPIIVMNKADLLTDTTRPAAEADLAPYKAIPYPVIMTSTVSKMGLAELEQHLQGKTAVLVGPSGVGKSSIISSLNGDEIRVGDVTAKGAGKHTTTATRLYHLPQGGHLIDSPGVREFNLWPVKKAEVLRGFKEFSAFLSGCKFRDCQHTAEPGCAVQAAVESGKISAQRYANFQELMKKASENDKHAR